jgi:MFS family permease
MKFGLLSSSAKQPVELDNSSGDEHSSKLMRAFSALTLPQFRTLWLGMFFSLGAMQTELVARSWLAFDLSGSAFLLGVVAMARGIPQVVLSPLAGVAADRFDRRNLLLASQSVLLVLALINAVLVQMGVIQIWHLFVIGLLQGIAFPFTMPTRSAFMSVLVGKRHMANALALDSTGRNLNMIAAPAIAGILIAWNPVVAFYTIAAFYALAVLTLIQLPSGSRGNATTGGTIQQMLVGFRYIFANRKLSMLILLSIVPILVGMPFQQLLPVFQKEVLDVGPEALGLMFAMIGVGALLGSLGAAYFSNSPNMGKAQVICGLGFGIGLFAFALSPIYIVSLALLVVVGLTSQTYLTINRSLLMLNTDPNLYGRVMSVYVMQWYLMPVALLPLGALADWGGVGYTIALSGLIITLFVAAIFSRSPQTFRASRPAPVTASGD